MVAPRAAGVGGEEGTRAAFEVLVECPACGARDWVSTDGSAAQCRCGAELDPAAATLDAADVAVELELVHPPERDGATGWAVGYRGRLEWIDGTRFRFTVEPRA